MKKIKPINIVYISLLFFSFFVSCYLFLCNEISNVYGLLFLCPFFFFIITLVYSNKIINNFTNIGFIFTIILFFIRMVISPLLMGIGGYASVFSKITRPSINYAILLSSFEYLIVVTLIVLICKNRSKNENKVGFKSFKSSTAFNAILFILTLYLVLVFIFLPQCRLLYRTIFDIKSFDFTTQIYTVPSISNSAIQRAFLTLFKMDLDIVRLLLPIKVMILIKRSIKNNFFGIVFCILLSISQLMIISSTMARAVISCFLLLVFTAKLYPKHKKRIIRYSLYVTLFGIIGYFFVRLNVGSRYGSTTLDYFCKIMNAYFSGIPNIAASLNIPNGYRISTFFGSLYSAIPFNSSLFGMKVIKLQNLFNECNNTYGQIVPMISEGNYYFGFILSPVFSVVCSILAFKFGDEANKQNDPWHYISYIFISIMFAIAIIMYDMSIILIWLLEWLVPMLILSNIAVKKKGEDT